MVRFEKKVNNAQALRLLRLSGGFLSLAPRAQFRVSGKDRTRYLNSQLSNDLRKAMVGTVLPCCLLTAKGKMCALVWASQQEDTWLIDADLEVRQALQTRLERYIVTDDVQIEDISDSGTLFHIFGKVASTLPANLHVSRVGFPGIDVWVPKSQMDVTYKKLVDQGILEATKKLFEPLRIAQGIPKWGAEMAENSFPAEVGLDHSAVDFAKGCYVGQEIVSRIRSVGRVNRRLVGFVALTENSESNLPPTSRIIDPISKAYVGTLTSTAFHFELSKVVALGYLKNEFISSSGIFLAIHPQSGEEIPLQTCEFPLLTAGDNNN